MPATEKTKLHSAVSPGEYGWIGAGSGKSGVTFNYVVGQHRAGVELYIDRGQGAEDENMRIFESLAERSVLERHECGLGGAGGIAPVLP